MKQAWIFFLSISCLGSSSYIEREQNFIVCMDSEEINCVGMIDRSIYRAAVQQLPICCVDVFVYNPKTKSYFLLLRKDKPAQGIFCVPGGRLFKGESFFDCARRKCAEEAQLEVEPKKIIGVYNTIFPDSAWDCQTHTIGIGVFAILTSQSAAQLDIHHDEYRWQDIHTPPEHPYLKCIYEDAIEYISI